MNSGEECFAVWAPDGVLWSEWAKPVVFAHPSGTMLSDPPVKLTPVEVPGAPEMWTDTAIVVELPGDESVRAGLTLAERGFRPVPLFNGTSGPAAVIDLDPIVRALGSGTEQLARLQLPPNARPAFLLDSRRLDPFGAGEPGRYDNRWVVLPQDLPSAAFLGSQGVRSVTLVQRGGTSVADDLSHVLRRWQDGGLRIRVVDLATGQIDEHVDVPRPSRFRLAWYAATALFGLRRSNVGGFGSTVPEQTARSGFYG